MTWFGDFISKGLIFNFTNMICSLTYLQPQEKNRFLPESPLRSCALLLCLEEINSRFLGITREVLWGLRSLLGDLPPWLLVVQAMAQLSAWAGLSPAPLDRGQRLVILVNREHTSALRLSLPCCCSPQGRNSTLWSPHHYL